MLSDTAAPSPSAAPSETPSQGQRRLIFALATVIAVSLPFLFSAWPPVADLPQHAAQARLFLDAQEEGSPYRVQWLTPYALVYGVFLVGQLLLPPIVGAKVSLWIVAVAWALAWHLLAARFQRPPELALLAGCLLFHQCLYWGFLNFLWGFPLFAIWLSGLSATRRCRWSDITLLVIGLCVLYSAHALWWLAGLVVLGLDTLAARSLTSAVKRLAAVLPTAILALLFANGLRTSVMAKPPTYDLSLVDRWHPRNLIDAMFGGPQGLGPSTAFAALAVVVLSGILLSRATANDARWTSSNGQRFDLRLLAPAAVFLSAFAILPTAYNNTILFNSRWLPYAIGLLLLAAPWPIRRRRLLLSSVLVTTLAVSGWTARTWQRVNAEELTGLTQALEALPSQPRLLGLDYLSSQSDRLTGRPYLQLFAYGQLLRGGDLNFSFADFPTSLVVWKEPARYRWTPGLEWFPDRVRHSDLQQFDFVLVGGPEEIHRQFAASTGVVAMTSEGQWRLYRTPR